MMKHTLLPLLALVLSAFPLLSQSEIAKAFDSARDLNDKQEYLAAANAFHEIQSMALREKNVEEYVNSLIAEAECYYMLNLVNNMQKSLMHAKQAYQQYADSVESITRQTWAISINKLEGSYFYCMTDIYPFAYKKAESLFRSCLDLIDSIDPNDNGMKAVIHRELLSLNYKHNRYEKALVEADFVLDYCSWELGYVEKPLSPADLRMNNRYIDAFRSKAMVLGRLHRFDEAYELLSELPKSCDKEPSILRTKGKLLMMQYDFDGTDRRKEALEYYTRYVALLKAEAAEQLDQMTDNQREQYWLNLHDFLFDCYRLENYAPEMLYDLSLFSKGYLLEYNNKKRQESSWKDVQKTLDKNSCAIEFVQYNGKDDSKQLGALVLTKQSKKPLFLHIADVDRLMQLRLLNYVKLGDALMSTDGEDKNAIYSDPDLPRLIWTEELLNATDGANLIYFSADGILHQLAIEFMMPDSTHSCKRLTSTRRLLDKNKLLKKDKMLLIGGVDYAAPTSTLALNNDTIAYLFLQPYADGLNYLPGTSLEIDSILNLRYSTQDMKIDGSKATDEAFKVLANHYPIVHVATHGYFCGILDDGSQMRTILSDNSMSQSGLVFSGAQYALRDSMYNLSLSDGLLSAKELSAIPLDSVELMVLSACETGLGYVTADGVYGIQRALKQAGVKAMILSLWDVDDDATALLMKYFYRNLKEDENADVYKAFMNARQQLIDTKEYVFHLGSMSYKCVYRYSAPQYANAFILIDIK